MSGMKRLNTGMWMVKLQFSFEIFIVNEIQGLGSGFVTSILF